MQGMVNHPIVEWGIANQNLTRLGGLKPQLQDKTMQLNRPIRSTTLPPIMKITLKKMYVLRPTTTTMGAGEPGNHSRPVPYF
jgi:hypothetical protein